MSQQTAPTPDEVQNAVESSGYPLEIRVAHVFARRGYETTPSWVYPDPRTGDSREVDVAAWRTFELSSAGDSRQRSQLGLHVLVECKRSPAFVIYAARPATVLTGAGRNPMASSYFGEPGSLWTTQSPGGAACGEDIVGRDGLGKTRWKWPDSVGSHFTFVQALRRQTDEKQTNRPQFKAGDDEFYHNRLLGLLKGIHEYGRLFLARPLPGGSFGVRPHFVVPILLVDADLYEYDVASSAPLRPIVRAALCRTYWGEFFGRFRVDIVREHDLPHYLDDLERDFGDIASQIASEYHLWEHAETLDANIRGQREGNTG